MEIESPIRNPSRRVGERGNSAPTSNVFYPLGRLGVGSRPRNTRNELEKYWEVKKREEAC